MGLSFGDILKSTVSPVGGYLSYKDKKDAAKYASDSAANEAQNKADFEAGKAEGRERAKELYGIEAPEIGQEVSMIRQMRKDRLDGKDPATTSLRESRNRRIRMARARGATDQEIAQIERDAESDIGRSIAESQGQRLSEYEQAITGALRGTTGMETGYGQLAKSGEMPVIPTSSGVTVICTELHRQGYMSDDILEKDAEYGRLTRLNDPFVYIGYIFLATPVVNKMKESPLLTKIVSVPAMAWANEMAGNGNLFGKIVMTLGTPICRIVGKLIGETDGIQSAKA